MSRIPTAAAIADAPEASRSLLEAVERKLGSAPNLYRLVAQSPAALEGLVALGGALEQGALDPPTRERVALAVADINGCDYCLAAHSFLAARVAKLDAGEVAANRAGRSNDPKADAALRFATALARERGQVGGAAVEAARAAGLSDAELLEVVAHVALNTLTNYVNEAFETEVDFPAAASRAA